VVKPILPVFGLKHPLWLQIVPPLIVFVVLMIIFKVVGFAVSRKVNVFYKYKTDDKSRLKWERLNHRLGMSLGLVNGAVYFVLILIPFYVAGYLTTQVASGAQQDPAKVRFVNAVRSEMHATKVDKVVSAYDPAPTNFYEAADIVGLLKANPLLDSRLSRYPVFLSLGERPEFQALANDVQINQMIQTQAKISDILAQPKVQAIVTNAEIATQIGKLVGPDLHDLHEYLLTGKSAKYDDEKILGYWTINVDATVKQEKVANPKITPFQLMRLKQTKYASLYGTTFIATTENRAILKKPAPNDGSPAPVWAEGTWKSFGSNYQITLGDKQVDATVENGRLLIPHDDMTFVFEKEQ
jgi:hypothetical protein